MMINEKHMFIKPQTWCWLIVGFEMVWGNKKNGRSNLHLTHSRRYKEQLGIMLVSTYNIHVGKLICLKLQCFLHVSKTTIRFQCSGGPNPAIHSLDTNEFGESLIWKESRTHQLYGVSENLWCLDDFPKGFPNAFRTALEPPPFAPPPQKCRRRCRVHPGRKWYSQSQTSALPRHVGETPSDLCRCRNLSDYDEPMAVYMVFREVHETHVR